MSGVSESLEHVFWEYGQFDEGVLEAVLELLNAEEDCFSFVEKQLLEW